MARPHNITCAAPLILALALVCPCAAEVMLKVATDRPGAIYQVGETAAFIIEANQDGKPLTEGKVEAVFSKDGVQPQPPQTLDLKDGKVTISGALEEPGFLLLSVRSGAAIALASAGFDPEKLQPSMPVPEDFDEFWSARKAELAAVPANSTLVPVASNNVPSVEIFDVKIDCIGPSVTGYFGRPKTAKPKSLPAILSLHGAGVVSASLGRVASLASKEGGMLAMDINAHGLPNGKSAEFYAELAKNEYAGYPFRGRNDRQQAYFLGMFLRVLRAIDFLAAQPEWDGKTLILYGTSQGAFQVFAGAALDHRVSFICAGVPAGCDHTGFAAGRISGWPKWVTIHTDGTPEPAEMEASRYFDNVNFARRIQCAGAAITVGFVDVVCPPTTVYAACNALTVPKSMRIDSLAGHVNTPSALEFLERAVVEHIRKTNQSSFTRPAANLKSGMPLHPCTRQ